MAVLAALAAAEAGLRLWSAVASETVDAALARSATAALAPDGETFNLMGLVRASAWPDIVYELKPGLAGTFRGHTLRTNRFGLRGPDVAHKPPGTRRIVGLGHSRCSVGASARTRSTCRSSRALGDG
jgi:hypothetical protein